MLSPAIGLFCHRHLARLLARLDAGVEASGPHDLAVREINALVSSAARVPHPAPRFVTLRNAPLPGQDVVSCRVDLPDGESGIFLQPGLDW